jgi:hypothetical protein
VLTLELGLAVTTLARFDEIAIDPTVLAFAADLRSIARDIDPAPRSPRPPRVC